MYIIVILPLSTFNIIIIGIQCPYPATTLQHGQLQCTSYSLKINSAGFYAIVSIFIGIITSLIIIIIIIIIVTITSNIPCLRINDWVHKPSTCSF